jgi:predicted aspartyl protease
MTKVRLLAATLSLLLLAGPSLAEEGCHLTRIAQLDMTIDTTGRIEVPMTVAGQRLNMLIDTGGVNSSLTAEAVDTLGLHPEIFNNVKIVAFGGQVIDHYVTAHDIDFGGLRAHSMTFLVEPRGRMFSDVQGILGPEVLRAYDDDFDFANGKFSLFERSHCGGNLVYWTSEPHAEIPFRIDDAGHILFYVVLDGKEIRVTLDTGASGSVLNLEQAEDLFGFSESDPLLKPVRTTVNGRVYRYPFKTMTIGGVTVNNPDLALVSRADSRFPGRQPALLGITVLRQLHMYISYSEEKIFVTAATAH